MPEFDKFKDILYKGNKVPREIEHELHRDDITLNELIWYQAMSVPSVLMFSDYNGFDASFDDYTLGDEFMFFLDDTSIEYTDQDYFNLNKGLYVTVFRLPPNTQLIKLKFQWDLYKLSERED